jgi:hypothetical protein
MLIFVEGVYIKDSPLFKFENCVPASDKVITLGAKKIVTVWDGEVGVSYLRGKLVVFHLIFFSLQHPKGLTTRSSRDRIFRTYFPRIPFHATTVLAFGTTWS